MLGEFERLCRKSGLPLTIQKRVIFEALLRRGDHPTADDIYDEALTRIRGISRTTVYRVLEALVRIGVADKVSHPGVAVRFEIKAERYHHLVCNRCNQVIDLEDSSLNTLPFPQRAPIRIQDLGLFNPVSRRVLGLHEG